MRLTLTIPEAHEGAASPSGACSHSGDLILSPSGELRCACGSLLGRWVGEGLELKCRRCKRTVDVPLSRGG